MIFIFATQGVNITMVQLMLLEHCVFLIKRKIKNEYLSVCGSDIFLEYDAPLPEEDYPLAPGKPIPGPTKEGSSSGGIIGSPSSSSGAKHIPEGITTPLDSKYFTDLGIYISDGGI